MSAVLVLAGCKSDDSEFMEYLSSGQALEEAGDLPRALVQYRNALRVDPSSVEARAAVAAARLAQGDTQQAWIEYSTLVERFPAEVQWRRILGEIAFISADWATLRRQSEALMEIAPESDAARELMIATDYREASIADDDMTADMLAIEAETRLEAKPTDTILLRLVAGHRLSGDNPETALPLLDRALEIEPRMADIQIARVKLLSDLNDIPQLESRLLELAALYPNDPDIAGLVVARHMSEGRIDQAEAILRALVEGAPAGDATLPTLLVSFLKRVHGPSSALAELDRLQSSTPGSSAQTLYAAMAEAVRFDAGQTEDAITTVKALLDGLEEGRESRRIRVLLATMLDQAGDQIAAREQVDRVLAVDPGNVAALKLQAGWAIDAGDPLAAVVDLRVAQERAPRDTEVMNLLAATHAMEGKANLALAQLARAAQMSGNGPRESERYVRALLAEGRTNVAERVLDAALDAAPVDVPLISLLAQLRLDRADWEGVTELDAQLAALDDPAAQAVLVPLRIVASLAQGDETAVAATLNAVLEEDTEPTQAVARIARALLVRDQVTEARQIVDRARALRPNLPGLSVLAADIAARNGDIPAAEALLSDVADSPAVGATAIHRLVLLAQGRGDAAQAGSLLQAGLAQYPGSLDLALLQAGDLLAQGDFPGAIAIYETLYRTHPDSLVVANDLASLLSTNSDDPAEIARAAQIAAPLHGNGSPAVADTLGWIAYRQGETARALPLLRRAARGLPDDPGVRLRLAE
ncbi:MAG: tetratricopeptide repeat protein, partial [Pseudomonadota bacterium]